MGFFCGFVLKNGFALKKSDLVVCGSRDFEY